MNKTKSFVKEIISLLKGDDAEATGQKVLRQADSAFKTQIASLTGDTIALEDRLEDAKENLRLTRLNFGLQITDRNSYIRSLLDAEATGQKVLRQADSAFKTQIASLTGDTIALEDRLEDAKENLRLTRLNHGLQITDRNSYIRSLLDAKNLLTSTEEALELHNAKLDFLREQAALLEE